jgi:hypothetical protein
MISQGQDPLGFLNPWLYGLRNAYPPVFTDVRLGSNPGCDTNGFPAIVGWDPVRSARLVSLHFRRWLILCPIGHGSGDTELSKAAEQLGSKAATI